MSVPEEWDALDVVRLQCGPEQYNDLGTGFLGSGFFVVKTLLGLGSEAEPLAPLGPRYFTPLSLAVLAASYLGFTVLSSNLAVPGGIFLPSILTGASFGALCGSGLTAALPEGWGVQPGLYAMVGATAMLGGVFRSSISLVVIVVEGGPGWAQVSFAIRDSSRVLALPGVFDASWPFLCRHAFDRLAGRDHPSGDCLQLDSTPPDHGRGV